MGKFPHSGQRRVQQQLEKIITQVVVCRDVASAAREGVAFEEVAEFERGPAEADRDFVHLIGQREVAGEEADQRGEVVAVPQAMDVAFRGAEVTAEYRITEETRVVDGDGAARVSVAVALCVALCVVCFCVLHPCIYALCCGLCVLSAVLCGLFGVYGDRQDRPLWMEAE